VEERQHERAGEEDEDEKPDGGAPAPRVAAAADQLRPDGPAGLRDPPLRARRARVDSVREPLDTAEAVDVDPVLHCTCNTPERSAPFALHWAHAVPGGPPPVLSRRPRRGRKADRLRSLRPLPRVQGQGGAEGAGDAPHAEAARALPHLPQLQGARPGPGRRPRALLRQGTGPVGLGGEGLARLPDLQRGEDALRQGRGGRIPQGRFRSVQPLRLQGQPREGAMAREARVVQGGVPEDAAPQVRRLGALRNRARPPGPPLPAPVPLREGGAGLRVVRARRGPPRPLRLRPRRACPRGRR